MHPIPPHTPVISANGLLFHVSQLNEALPDAPDGIWIENDFVAQNPILWRVEREGISYLFAAINPLLGVPVDAPIVTIRQVTCQCLPGESKYGNSVAIRLYVDWTKNLEKTRSLFENAIAEGTDPPEVKQIVHQILATGYEFGCKFVNFLRRRYSQYWLTQPSDLFNWSGVQYFSSTHQWWYSIRADDQFATSLLERKWTQETEKTRHPHILLNIIDSSFECAHEQIQNEPPYSFAEEIVAMALIELRNNRARSAILHAIIALESATLRGLESLLKSRLAGLEQGSVLNAISKELSVSVLARIVYTHFEKPYDKLSPDWDKIGKLYTIRNEVIHRGRRRLPDFESLKGQILEVWKYVDAIEGMCQTP